MHYLNIICIIYNLMKNDRKIVANIFMNIILKICTGLLQQSSEEENIMKMG